MIQATLLAAVMAAGAPGAEASLSPAAATFHRLLDEDWEARLREDPLLASATGDRRYDDRLPSVTPADLDRAIERRRAILARLPSIDRGALDTQDRISYDMLARELRDDVADHGFGDWRLPINADSGFHTSLAQLPRSTTFSTVRDYENYIARLRAFPAYIAQQIANMREGLNTGFTLPRVVLEGYDVTIRTHVVTDPAASVFYEPFRSFPPGVPEGERPRLEAAGRAAVAEGAISAYRSFLDFMTGEYIPKTRTTIAASDLPRGREYYAHRVRAFTTLDVTPEEVHRIGLAEVDRIHKEMMEVIRQTGFEGDFAAFLHFLRTDSRFYTRTPEELLRQASFIAKRMDGKLPALFGRLPRLPYGVEAVPAHLAPKYTGGRYVPAPVGGMRAGTYWVNTYALESRPLYILEALTLHEAVPGHHLQIALQQELQGVPPFRRAAGVGAFVEGWGLYSERLGLEAGFYQDPYSNFGRLTYEMWRACRLVVDTGMHALGWSREKAMEFMAGHTALSLHEVRTETDRYISWPGQALAYKMGELKIRELRRMAEAELGPRFDIRGFHDAVLANGPVPLPVLEEQIRAYVAARRVAAAAPLPSGPPCAACVTWRATAAEARPLLDGPGRLEGLDVLVAIDDAQAAAEAFTAARDLAARGATVGVELPLFSGSDLTPLAGLASRVVLRLPAGVAIDDALVFAVRTRATAMRASVTGATVGLAGPADLLLALAARGIAPYVSLLFPNRPAPGAEEAGSPFEWWSLASDVESVEDLLARTSDAAGERLVLPLSGQDVPIARAVAAIADLLPSGLTALETVTVCEQRAAVCATPVFIHPRTLDAVAVVFGGGRLAVRPGATRASGRSLQYDHESALPLTSRAGETEVDARALSGAFVLRLGGWAGGEAGFTAAVEVTAARALSVAEILAAHQAAAARQALRVRTLVATGSTVMTFQVPGLAAPMTVTAETVLYRGGGEGEIEQRDLRLNGAPVAVGADGVPRLPLVQPERVASPPLSIALGDAYVYRLLREEVKSGQACYVVAFEPRVTARPSYRGRAWIAKEEFALVRLEATQTGLRGAIVSSRQEDEYRPVEVGGTHEWMLARSDVEQLYEGAGHRTQVRRRIAFDLVEANAPDFEPRLHAARASPSVMMRETPEGFRYLRRVSESPAEPRGAEEPTGAAVTGGRALAGRASRVWSIALGTLFDPNIDRPLPFAGLSYVDFDVLGTGAQMSALVAGPFAQVALSVPSVGGPGLQVQAWAFAALARYNDRSFRGGRERYDENLGQRPLRASVAAVRKLGARARLRVAYDLDAVRLDPSDTTAADFRLPASPVAHGARTSLEWERGAWSATAWGSAAWRQAWREWGHAGDFSPEAQGYQRAGLSLTRSFVLSPAVVTRLEATALVGRDLDRFSRFGFDAFDSRLRGYPSAGIRFDRGAVLRTAATWAARRTLRVGAFLDAAIVHDPTSGARQSGHLGTGAALETALPGRFLLNVDWGFGLQAQGRDGRRGTHVLRVTAYKVL